MRTPHSADLDMPVGEIMRAWPATISVFLRYRMHCVGCALAPFHMIAEACVAHAVDERELRAALRSALKRKSGGGD